MQEGVLCTLTGLPTQPQDKAGIAPFIIEIDFSPTCITKIYPSYFELGMCRSTKITISIQQQGQPKVLMLRNASCFIPTSVRIRPGSAFAQNSRQPSPPCLACYFGGGLRAIAETYQFTRALLACPSFGFIGLTKFQNKQTCPIL